MSKIVEAILDTERQRRIEPFENWKSQWTTKVSAFQELNTRLTALHTAVKALDTPSEFLVKTASTSDETVLSAAASSNALHGAYTIEIGSSIKHRLGSAGYADNTNTALAAQNDQIEITVGSSTETIILGPDPTPLSAYNLEDIASEINSLSTLVTAEVINDGSSANQYRLVLTANTGGTDNRIVIGTNNTSVDFELTGVGDRVDDPEGTLHGTAVAQSSGTYLGSTNKAFSFTVAGSSGSSYTVGSDSFDISWTDNEGNSGSITVTAAGTPVEVFQGVTVQFTAGEVQGADTFSVDVWHPDLQAPQDSGLATSEKEIHSGFVDRDTTAVTLADATFSYVYNGQTTQIDVNAGSTLSDLVDLINNDSQNLGITASIINDGTGLATSYHLVLTGNDTGAANKVENISQTLDQFSGNFSETQSAQNAMVRIDGYPADDSYLRRDTNTVDDLISGVTFSLVGTGTATVTVATDTAAVKEKITSFVSAFNEVRTYIKEQTAYNTTTNSPGALLGNYGVDTIKNRLNAIVSSLATGFRSTHDTYVNLMELGIRTDTDLGSETQGQLIIDESELDSALASHAEDVADLFSAYFSGRSAHTSLNYYSYIPGITEPGTYEVHFDSINPSQSQMRLQGGTWHIVEGWDSVSQLLTGAAGTPEAGLTVNVTNTSSSLTGEVDLKLGIAGKLKEELDLLTNASAGPLVILEDNYQDIIESIDNRIQQEESRIALYEQRLNERFARLENLLTELNGQSDYISSRLQQLS